MRDEWRRELHRSALGAEELVPFEYSDYVIALFDRLRADGFAVVGLEQNERSVALPEYSPSGKVALLLGEEVHGLTNELISKCDTLVEIPMFGTKESYNVAVATGIALYHIVLAA